MLDIGTTYTNSRIRCDAEVDGHTGYAGLHAQSSYDMYLNLQTTRVNGGWVHHKINGVTHLLLSGSGLVIKYVKPLVAQYDDRLK